MGRSPLALATGLALLAAPLLGQATVYGDGCPGLFPTPVIQHSGGLLPGHPATVTLSGTAPNATAMLIVGTQNTTPEGEPLAIPLDGVAGMQPGCTLDTDVLLWSLGQTDATGSLSVSFGVPHAIGPDVNFQFAVLESSAPLSLVMSPPLNLHIPLVVTPDASDLALPPTSAGDPGDPLTLTLSNDTPAAVQVDALELAAATPGAFTVTPLAPLPAVLQPGETLGVQLVATPAEPGVFDATLSVRHAGLPPSFPDPVVRLRAAGLGPPGLDLLLDAGGPGGYVDAAGQTWAADGGFDDALTGSTSAPVTGTLDPALYQGWREGAAFTWSTPLPDGAYGLTLHAAELQHGVTGARVFDVLVEGQLRVDDLDLAAVVGPGQAWQQTVPVDVRDGALDVAFEASADVALVAALELRALQPALLVTPEAHDFGLLPWSDEGLLPLTVTNAGTASATLDTLVFHVHEGAGEDFVLDLAGQQFSGEPDMGGHHELAFPVDLELAPGASQPATLTWSPSQTGPSMLQLQWHGDFETVVGSYAGEGGGPDHPYLVPHVADPGPLVDWDGLGSRPVAFDGSGSTTLEAGHALSSWDWSANGLAVETGELVSFGLTVGAHEVCLTIADDHAPPQTSTLCVPVEVHTTAEVPGVLARYWSTGPTDPATLLLAPPAAAPWTELREDFRLPAGPTVGGSPFDTQVLVSLSADVWLPHGNFTLQPTGGGASAVLVDGSVVTSPHPLPTGVHTFEVRYAIDGTGELPLDFLVGPVSGEPAPFAPDALSHDQGALPPALNALSATSGSAQGGDVVQLSGAGFFPSHALTVHWGPLAISGTALQIDEAQRITLVTPPLPPGPILVSVETPAGTSDALGFTVDGGVGPQVTFAPPLTVTLAAGASCMTWAPDGRLFVGLLDGTLIALTFDDDWNVTASQLFPGVSALPNRELLALAVDPHAPPSPVRLLAAHTDLAAQGGVPPVGPAPYPGAVSALSGPAFDAPETVVSGLPTSNALHGPTALLVDHAGDLLIAVGGNTNAGVTDAALGGLPESPLSGALLEARTSSASFDGAITYADATSGLPDDDQRNGEQVVQSGGDVSVRAAGLRNPTALVLTDAGRVLALDQGAVFGLGEGSTGPASSGGQAQGADELVRLEQGHYLGHANRARGAHDPRQDVWHDDLAPALPDVFQQAIGAFPGPLTGLVEYEARTFADALRGELLLQTHGGDVRRVRLSADGEAVESVATLLPGFGARALLRGPGGAILGLDLGGGLRIARPVDPAAGGYTAYDVFPDRAPATGGTPFVIGGVGLGSLATTSVRFDGQPAVLSSVSDTRIHGVVPATAPSVERLDVEVDVAGDVRVLDRAFRSLFVPAGSEPARWEFGADAPVGLSEISVGIIDGIFYVVGDGDDGTFAYDPQTDTWTSGLAQRPFTGDHQPCEVWGGRMYLMGGLGNGADGKVQIYDPATDSWSLGATMPWNAGSSCTARIGDLIYVAGGIKNNSSTSNKVAAYDPASDSWGPFLASMPLPRNHAASGTDGEKLWVFGGRGPGSGDINILANGFPDVQVYDPVSDSWDSSSFPGSELVELPIERGGTGKAVWYHDHFWVMGGETLDGPGATPDNVYERVDVYDPATHSWRLETPMPTPRHGSFPVRFENRIYVIAGGWKASTSFTTVNEILVLD